MGKPCGHVARDRTCPVCDRYATREDYRLLWDGKPMSEVCAASKRVAARLGGRPTFSMPGGTAAHSQSPAPVTQGLPSDKCVHLGITVPNTSGGCRTTHVCDNGHGHVRPCVECRSCKDYQSEDSDE